MPNYFEVIKREWRKILVVTLLVILVVLVVTLIQPFKYRAGVSVFVVQKSSFSIDAYSASKSEERIANRLSQIIYSSSFLDRVLYSGFNVDQEYFPKDELKRRKLWQDTVSTSVPAGFSKIDISVFHQEPDQALQLSNAISFVLTSQKQEFIGIEDVDLKVLDTPLVSKYPVKPNVAVNLLVGIIIGIALGIAFVILTYDPNKNRLFADNTLFDDEDEPHLIDYDDIPVDESVEDDMDEVDENVGDLEEITDLDDVEELEEAEEDTEMEMPDISDQLGIEDSEDDNNMEDMSPPEIPEKEEESDLPNFTDEDQFFGPPGK